MVRPERSKAERALERAGRIIQELATPAGFERPRNPVKPGEDRPSPTEGEKGEAVLPRLTGRSGSKVAKLALVAMNAVRNGDLHRAVEVLEAIQDECVPAASTAGRSPVGSRRDRW